MKQILITRPRAQADNFAERLQAVGFEPIFFPVIEIRPIENNVELEQSLANLNNYDWIVFTSVNGVDVVFNNPGLPKGDRDAVGKGLGVRVAAIGPKTAEALQARGVTPDFVPDEYVAESILPGLGDVRGKWVLLPRAEIARKALPEAIREAGGIPHEVPVYQTLPVQPDPAGLAALRSGVDVVTLTSPSTVQNFAVIAQQNMLDPLHLPGNPLFACIGPITEQAAREEGFVNLMVAREYTTEGLIEVIRSLEVS